MLWTEPTLKSMMLRRGDWIFLANLADRDWSCAMSMSWGWLRVRNCMICIDLYDSLPAGLSILFGFWHMTCIAPDQHLLYLRIPLDMLSCWSSCLKVLSLVHKITTEEPAALEDADPQLSRLALELLNKRERLKLQCTVQYVFSTSLKYLILMSTLYASFGFEITCLFSCEVLSIGHAWRRLI